MDDDARSGKAKFKSKWNRVFKEKDEHEQQQNPKHTNSFKLDDDVAEFLKPSTDNSNANRPAQVGGRPSLPAPKLDTAIAQRWPEAHEVRKASAETGTPNGGPLASPNGFRKPRRRKGLRVGFVRREVEIIGEGGDESEEAPAEVGRRRLMRARAQSDARMVQRQVEVGRGLTEEEDFVPKPLRRVQTSHSSATPLGHEEWMGDGQASVPRIDPEMPSSGPPRDVEALAIRKRELRSSEGLSLRRVSALIQEGAEDEDEEQKRQSMGFGVQLSDQHYETLSRPDAPDLLPEPRSATTPRSAKSPLGPSPFDDPKYAKRRSQVIMDEQPLQSQPPAVMAASASLRPKRENYQPSYMRASQPPQPLAAPSEATMPYPQRYPAGASQTSAAGMSTTQSQQQPLQQSRSRDPSPRPFYAQDHRSSGSLGHFPPSPTRIHSRSSSRDGPSQPSPPRLPFQNQSPQSNSPRSSIIGRSPLSPQGSAPAAAQPGYFVGQRPQQGQSLQPPPGGLQVDDPSSRPVSASSSRSFSRPLNNFSAPRPLQTGQAPVASSQHVESQAPSATIFPTTRPQASDLISFNAAQPQTWHAKSASSNIRVEDASRPGSSSDSPSTSRPVMSSRSTAEGNPAADAAYTDFAGRVEHMKGVFKLIAQNQQPSDGGSPHAWLRAALWWYTRGKAGLEVMLQQQRPRDLDGQFRELLTQPHVDLAKTWWILSDPLEAWDGSGETSPQSANSPNNDADMALKQSVATLKGHIKSLSLSMGKNQLMPPPQSLIQGQDTTIWLEYPRFSTDAAAALAGRDARRQATDTLQRGLPPLDAFPLGDTGVVHCYGRFPVEISMGTDDAASDRAPLQCVLTMLRGKREYIATVVIASQSELVNLKIAPRQGDDRGLTWHDVSWKASSAGMIIRLHNGYDLMVRMSDKDFRSLWNIVEYARKVDHCFRPDLNEKYIYEGRLAELQYADSSNANAFPPEKIKGAVAAVFEKTTTMTQGGRERIMHRGYRLLLVTNPKHKSLASASHEICQRGPLLFEFMTDSAAHGMAAMVVRVREETRQCRILLVFPDVASRQNFYDVLNGIVVSPEEMIVSKVNLASINIEPATQTEGFSLLPHTALQQLQWQKLGITNSTPDEHSLPTTVESDSLRVVARHATGCITDRLNFSKGQLLLRLPCTDTPAIQFLRDPQEDIIMSIDTRASSAQTTDGIIELLRLARTQLSIRTFSFPSFPELHAFQAAVTGCNVRFDGLAANISISRRRMVVPIYKKWEATSVRLQLVAHSGVVQVLAFMEGFSHADALCFQVKSTDTIENIKGDGKGKKWAVKLVDAKFALPKEREKGEPEPETEEKVRRRFVNLEGLEYMSEHDDITVGFETMEERDRFAEALPTAVTVSRGFTLKRRT